MKKYKNEYSIDNNKRMHNIGYYNTEEEAKEAVCLYCENQ